MRNWLKLRVTLKYLINKQNKWYDTINIKSFSQMEFRRQNFKTKVRIFFITKLFNLFFSSFTLKILLVL